MADEKDNLKNLHPEERIKKLKELEQKKKKEIEEAEKQIKESENELTEKIKWVEKVPIPQVAAEDAKELTLEEKEILKVHKGFKDNKKESKDEKEKDKKKTIEEEPKGISLEEAVSREGFISPRPAPGEYKIDAALGFRPNEEYVANLSKQPMKELYQQMATINKDFQDKGYLTSEEGRKIEYLTGAVDEKLKAVDSGKYSLTEDVALAANITQQLGSMLRNVYQSRRESTIHDWYKGR